MLSVRSGLFAQICSNEDRLLYFAYGSNMDEEDLENWCRMHNYQPVKPLVKEVAVLKGWKLVFNYYSATRCGGVANIQRCEGEEVWGLLMELTKDDFEKLRKKEGAPKVYQEKRVSVMTRDGLVKEAITFVVKQPAAQFVPPTPEYLNLLIRSAVKNGFPKDYIQKLKSIPTK
ncbi:MAG: gamma-glutamylcyclotransferase family protein [Candidatus Hadarchaeales archaeon]